MDDEQQISVQDLISLSYEQKPMEFQDAFNSIITDRIANAVNDRKIELAQSMFTGPDDHLDDDDDNAEIEDELDFEEDDDEILDQEEEQDGETA